MDNLGKCQRMTGETVRMIFKDGASKVLDTKGTLHNFGYDTLNVHARGGNIFSVNGNYIDASDNSDDLVINLDAKLITYHY